MNDIASTRQLQSVINTPETATPPCLRYIVVSQVKSNRVVYFTDDSDYQPPTDGDWYYMSSHEGPLPEGMTLRNCWGWRYNGGVFQDAREAPRRSATESLLDNNRKALLRILRDKIDAVREPFMPSCTQGETVRQAKLHEARAYLSLPEQPEPSSFRLLEAVAVARHISLIEAARLVVAKAEECERVLIETERFREQFAQAIGSARDEKALWALREWLLDKVYPELTREFRYRVENTEPPDLDKPLADVHRLHEITRLKVLLREAINRRREPLRSEYLGHDEVRRHKAALAQSLLENGGGRREGVDYSLFEVYAEARALPLAEAAHLLLQSQASARELLQQTERTKDRLLANIDAITTLRDVKVVEQSLKEL